MYNNRELITFTANTRRSRVLQRAPTTVQALYQRLEQSQVIPFNRDAYLALKKTQQDDLKDIGAYIVGDLKDGSRRNGCILSRGAAVLDADNLPAGSTEEFIRRVAALGVSCCIYSTAKHCAVYPRLRVVVPFAVDVSAEEYGPVVRGLCKMIQNEMTWFDKKKMQDPLIWRRMGLELAALHDLMTGILCDPEYQAVMDKQSFTGLKAAI